MSVLLEALKKAAEDKKKSLESSEQSNKIEVPLVQKDTPEKNMKPKPSVESEALKSKVQSALNKPAEIKLSLNESVVSAPLESIKKPEIIKPSPSPASKEASELVLKLDLNLDNAQKIEKTSDILNSTDEEVSSAKPQVSLKLAMEGVTEQNNSLLDKSCTEKTATLNTTQNITTSTSSSDESILRNMDPPDEPPIKATIDSFKEASIVPSLSSEKLKENDSIDLHLVKEGLDVASVTPALTKSTVDVLDEAQGSPESEQVVLKSNSMPFKTEFDEGGSREGVVSEHEESSAQRLQNSVKKSNLQIDKSSLKEDEDSYKWSLDALPGYLGLGKNKKIKKDSTESENPILVAGALSEDPARPTKKSSVKLILILLLLLLFIGIVFYGALYYQEQHDALEQRMKKYNLVKTHIAVEEGAGTVNKLSEKRAEKSDMNPTEEGVSQAPLNEAAHERASIEGVQKEPSVYTGESVPFEKNNQTRTEVQSQRDLEKSVTSEVATQKREAIPLPSERKMNSRVTNALKTSTQILDKKITKTASNTPRKAVIVVHSEEKVLSDAYLSYGQGDFTSAQQAFETVLTMNPKNEFALIGLGNILASDQQYTAAMGFYQKALAAQPSSLNAFEAMANISGHIELNSDWKSALSDMAQDHSESATLQYALGNVYAEENDWLSAQSAYFQAVALEPDNADYLVNLAVSLDQLGKYQLAARYYTEALAFVDVEAVNFNETQVKNRLISIRQFMAGRVQ